MLENTFRDLSADYIGPNVRLLVLGLLDFRTRHGEVACTISIKDASVANRIFSEPSMLFFGERYVTGDIEIQGDEMAALSMAEHLLGKFKGSTIISAARLVQSLSTVYEAIKAALGKRPANALNRQCASAAVAAHYDHPARFWELWLDRFLQYTCAYFGSDDETVDQAQERKMLHLLRKLDISAEQNLLDIGCGWGGFTRYLASSHGIKCTGITLSHEQAKYAQKRILEAGLEHQCRIIHADFRDFSEKGSFDAVSAIGVQEHLGRRLTPALFDSAARNLKPNGIFLNQAIAVCRSKPLIAGASFIDEHIFPEGDLLTIDETLAEGDRASFEVRDVENLREHYVATLMRWRTAFQEKSKAITEIVGVERFRAFNLYLLMSEHGFRTGRLHVYQTVFRKRSDTLKPIIKMRPEWRFTGDQLFDAVQKNDR